MFYVLFHGIAWYLVCFMLCFVCIIWYVVLFEVSFDTLFVLSFVLSIVWYLKGFVFCYKYRLILVLFYVLFRSIVWYPNCFVFRYRYRFDTLYVYVLFKYRLILSYFVLLLSHACAQRFMYLKTDQVWLWNSRLRQIVFRIYSVEQLLLYCDLKVLLSLQPPRSLH